MRDGVEVDQDMVFDAERAKEGWDCRADGYGMRLWCGEEGGYGNGSIYVVDYGGVTLLND